MRETTLLSSADTGNTYLTAQHDACLPSSLSLTKLQRNSTHVFSSDQEADSPGRSCHPLTTPYVNHHSFWREARTAGRNVCRTYHTSVSPCLPL